MFDIHKKCFTHDPVIVVILSAVSEQLQASWFITCPTSRMMASAEIPEIRPTLVWTRSAARRDAVCWCPDGSDGSDTPITPETSWWCLPGVCRAGSPVFCRTCRCFSVLIYWDNEPMRSKNPVWRSTETPGENTVDECRTNCCLTSTEHLPHELLFLAVWKYELKYTCKAKSH